MPTIEIPIAFKLAAVAVAAVTALLSIPQVQTFLHTIFNPSTTKAPVVNKADDVSEEVDTAIRVLIKDAMQRDCMPSVNCLNEYIKIRNTSLVSEA